MRLSAQSLRVLAGAIRMAPMGPGQTDGVVTRVDRLVASTIAICPCTRSVSTP
jgi:hypothetical protein